MFEVLVSTNQAHIQSTGERWRRRSGLVVWIAECCAMCASRDSIADIDANWIAGRMRLDDRCELIRSLGLAESVSDVRVAGTQFLRNGPAGLLELIGTLAFSVWEPSTRTLSVVRDALGLAQLWASHRGASLHVSDNLDALHNMNDIDKEFVAAFIATGAATWTRSIWRGIQPVPAGSVLQWHNGRTHCVNFWSAATFSAKPTDHESASEEFRRLFYRAVKNSLQPNVACWADLSGGHDSSSVACMAAVVSQEDPALTFGGTITYVDSLGDGDETRFVDTVVDRYKLCNERFHDLAPWIDDPEDPPLTPHPSRDFPFYARDRIVAKRIRAAGGSILLSGVGPDVYLPFTATHIPDMYARGLFAYGTKFLVEWSVARRERVWKTFLTQVLAPVVPARLSGVCGALPHSAPTWLRRDFVRRYGFGRHILARNVTNARPGHVMPTLVANRLSNLSANIHYWRLLPGIELRHPLLYRPLVQFCLELPESLRTDVHRPKPVLRAGLQTIVPAAVLGRHSKGSTVMTRVCWAFGRYQQRLENLIKRSVLADLGCIEPTKLAVALGSAGAGQLNDSVKFVYFALSLETWLAARLSSAGGNVASFQGGQS